MRIITALSGIALVATAVWCFAHTGTTFTAMAFVIGIAMIIQFIGGICSYISVRRELQKSSWILAEAISTGVLGIIVLSNQLTVEAMIPMFFGMWIMYSGMLRIIAAIHIILAKEVSWIWILCLGALAILAGVYSFFNLILLGLGTVTLIAVIFLIQGANVIALAINMPGKYKIFPKNEDDYCIQ